MVLIYFGFVSPDFNSLDIRVFVALEGANIDADVYLLIDGGATYDTGCARAMIERLIKDRLDMICAARIDETPKAYRRGHCFGNRLLTKIVAMVFGNRFHDILTGYRAFSMRFVKSFPTLSKGFEIG